LRDAAGKLLFQPTNLDNPSVTQIFDCWDPILTDELYSWKFRHPNYENNEPCEAILRRVDERKFQGGLYHDGNLIEEQRYVRSPTL
ncbi:MAG: hypothetical protein AAF585_17500, partial [Verrucomicrobiota bacterium]